MHRANQGPSVITFGKLSALQYKPNINFNIYRKRMAHKAGYWCVKICYLMQAHFTFNTDGNRGRDWLKKKKILLASLNSSPIKCSTATQIGKLETLWKVQEKTANMPVFKWNNILVNFPFFRKQVFSIENIAIFVTEKYILSLEKREQNER